MSIPTKRVERRSAFFKVNHLLSGKRWKSEQGIILILIADRTLANQHSPMRGNVAGKHSRLGMQHLCKRYLTTKAGVRLSKQLPIGTAGEKRRNLGHKSLKVIVASGVPY